MRGMGIRWSPEGTKTDDVRDVMEVSSRNVGEVAGWWPVVEGVRGVFVGVALGAGAMDCFAL